jgi:hypothetical protein
MQTFLKDFLLFLTHWFRTFWLNAMVGWLILPDSHIGPSERDAG